MPEPRISIWTPELIEQFLALHAQGLSFSVIAAALNISRNAAVGKAHRMNLAPRPRTQPKVARVRAARRTRAPTPTPHAPTLPQIESNVVAQPIISDNDLRAVTLHELEAHHCRWIVGASARGAIFCSAPRYESTSYCAFHAAQSRRKY
jgi:GcrA cell cycle regulator